MGVVELDRHILGQVEQAAALLEVTTQQILQRRGNEKVLLTQAQLLAGGGVVGRIEHPRDAFGTYRLGHRAEVIARIETRITSYNVCYTKLLRD